MLNLEDGRVVAKLSDFGLHVVRLFFGGLGAHSCGGLRARRRAAPFAAPTASGRHFKSSKSPLSRDTHPIASHPPPLQVADENKNGVVRAHGHATVTREYKTKFFKPLEAGFEPHYCDGELVQEASRSVHQAQLDLQDLAASTPVSSSSSNAAFDSQMSQFLRSEGMPKSSRDLRRRMTSDFSRTTSPDIAAMLGTAKRANSDEALREIMTDAPELFDDVSLAYNLTGAQRRAQGLTRGCRTRLGQSAAPVPLRHRRRALAHAPQSRPPAAP
jgi:hypothetical protein